MNRNSNYGNSREYFNIEKEGYKAVLSPNELVNQDDTPLYINQIDQLVAVPNPHFQTYYLSAIANYLSLTQHCSNEIIYRKLETITNGLKLRRSLILPAGAVSELANEKYDIWTYATFVSLLLHNLAQDVLGYVVIVRKPGNNECTKWYPLITTLAPLHCFKVVGVSNTSKYANPALITRIINDHGIAWLSQDESVFNTVLELIVSPNQTSPLGTLIYKANGLETTKASKSSLIADSPLLKTSTKTASKLSNNRIGRLFRDWLILEISNTTENANIHWTTSGIALIDPGIFQQFANNQQQVKWADVRSEFLKLNLHKINLNNNSAVHKIQLSKLGNRDVILITSIKKI